MANCIDKKIYYSTIFPWTFQDLNISRPTAVLGYVFVRSK